MTMIHQTRSSDSPYVETIIRGWTAGNGSAIRPAESHWHLVFVKLADKTQPIVVGPWTTAGVAQWGAGAEILWIKFKLGTFMPHLPTRNFLNREMNLPEATNESFWVNSSVWQFPNFENADVFVDQLVRNEILVCDPVVNTTLNELEHSAEAPSRTVRHRFLRSTGLSQKHIQQIERAQQAATLLGQGVSILDTVYEVGYFDQPHLTRSLKRFAGYTPTQIIRTNTSK